MSLKRYDRWAAALFLVPATVYLLYLGWSEWRDVTRGLADVLQAIGLLEQPNRGRFLGVLGDFRLLIEIVVAFLAASLVNWLLTRLPEPRPDDH